jgi:hypothetical protein
VGVAEDEGGMSRIRSIHPGFFTDEDIVGVSMAARMLFIGLGVEADDKGIFEWKPLTLKMRIFPADSLEVEPLLSELEGAGKVRQYQMDGKSYGAIYNFRRFQKPKTPNDIHPAPPEILSFVGLVSETGGDKPAPFPQNGEKAIQMEDGGGKMDDGEDTPEGGVSSAPSRASLLKEFNQSVWPEFPRNPEASKAAAFELFAELSHADRIACIRGVARVAIRFEESTSDEPLDRRLMFHPHLAKWIKQRGWEQELETA